MRKNQIKFLQTCTDEEIAGYREKRNKAEEMYKQAPSPYTLRMYQSANNWYNAACFSRLKTDVTEGLVNETTKPGNQHPEIRNQQLNLCL